MYSCHGNASYWDSKSKHWRPSAALPQDQPDLGMKCFLKLFWPSTVKPVLNQHPKECQKSSASSSDFWLTCRYRGHIYNSGPPSRQLACCTHGRSHTRSPGVSIMRVDSWELPLSAIPLYQLLPSHLGPPRPTLSINLYVKNCLLKTELLLDTRVWLL